DADLGRVPDAHPRPRRLAGERSGRAGLDAVRVVVGGQAPSGRQVVLPAVHRAGEDRAAGLAEPAEGAAPMRAAALDYPAPEPDLLLVVALVGVPPFRVHEPDRVQALEERVQVLVVRADPARPEPHAEEQAVDPVDLVVGDQPLEQRAVDAELVAAGLPRGRPDPAPPGADDDRPPAPPTPPPPAPP